MELRTCRTNMFLALLCALSLVFNSVHADTEAKESRDQQLTKNQTTEQKNDSVITRRQDNGFDFMRYFTGGSSGQQNQQANQQPRQSQQSLSLQQQHQLQQQQLAQQQLQQQKQLQALQQQQLLQQLQQQQSARSNDVYQDNQHQQQNALNREGGYGYAQQPKQIGISLGGGGGKPSNVIPVGNILTLLPRIFNILSTGGKVMFGVELGNNFYFGPVGAKPLYG